MPYTRSGLDARIWKGKTDDCNVGLLGQASRWTDICAEEFLNRTSTAEDDVPTLPR